jgi:hypothetical protein
MSPLLRFFILALGGLIGWGGVVAVYKGTQLVYQHIMNSGDYEFVGYLNTGNYPNGQGICPAGQPQSVGTGGQCTAIQPPDQTNNLSAAQCQTLKLWCTAMAGGNQSACDCSQHGDPHTFTYEGILNGYGYQVIHNLTYGQCLALGANTFGGFGCL